MGDKRQRARVQGSWAKPLPKPARPTAHVEQKSGSWKAGPGTYEFSQPTDQLIRAMPVEKVIEDAGVHEISQGPNGVSSKKEIIPAYKVKAPVKSGDVSLMLCRLRLLPGFLPLEQADWMFSKLLAELPWSQKTNYGMMGDSYDEPRLTCWYGESPYTYSHSTMQPNPQWHPILLNLRQAIEREISHPFNSLLCNLYRDGKDSIAWHSDNEASLGPNPTIASFSLGDTRVFCLRKKPPPEENGDYTYTEKVKIPLSHGTLLIMEGCIQDDWQHQVPKEYHDRGPRINLTFRTIYPEPVRSSKR